MGEKRFTRILDNISGYLNIWVRPDLREISKLPRQHGEKAFLSWTIGEQAVPVASQWQYYKVSLEVSPGSALTCRAAGHAAQLTGLFACPWWSFSKGPQWQSHSQPRAINDRVQQHIKHHILRNLHRLWTTARMPGTKGEHTDNNREIINKSFILCGG